MSRAGAARPGSSRRGSPLQTAPRQASRVVDDSAPAHTSAILVAQLGGIVRNTCRTPIAGTDAPTFDIVTTPDPISVTRSAGSSRSDRRQQWNPRSHAKRLLHKHKLLDDCRNFGSKKDGKGLPKASPVEGRNRAHSYRVRSCGDVSALFLVDCLDAVSLERGRPQEAGSTGARFRCTFTSSILGRVISSRDTGEDRHENRHSDH